MPPVNEHSRPAAPDPSLLARRTAELHDGLRQVDPQLLARRTGATYVAHDARLGSFQLQFWNRQIALTFPDFIARDQRSGKVLGTFDEAMLAYYFALSDGTPETGDWIAFSELPDGRFYTQAFQGYTGDELAKIMGNDDEGFATAAAAVQGLEVAAGAGLGDRAFVFRVLPYVSILAVCWLGDEDFPPSYRLLFDSAASHHLSTDACAILGGGLTRRLVKAYHRLAAGD